MRELTVTVYFSLASNNYFTYEETRIFILNVDNSRFGIFITFLLFLKFTKVNISILNALSKFKSQKLSYKQNTEGFFL